MIFYNNFNIKTLIFIFELIIYEFNLFLLCIIITFF